MLGLSSVTVPQNYSRPAVHRVAAYSFLPPLVSARASNLGSCAWDVYSIRGASLKKKKSHADPSRVQQGSSASRFGTLFLVLMSPGPLPVHGGEGKGGRVSLCTVCVSPWCEDASS